MSLKLNQSVIAAVLAASSFSAALTLPSTAAAAQQGTDKNAVKFLNPTQLGDQATFSAVGPQGTRSSLNLFCKPTGSAAEAFINLSRISADGHALIMSEGRDGHPSVIKEKINMKPSKNPAAEFDGPPTKGHPAKRAEAKRMEAAAKAAGVSTTALCNAAGEPNLPAAKTAFQTFVLGQN